MEENYRQRNLGSRDRITGPWSCLSVLFYLIVMQIMFSTKIAKLSRCHLARKARVDKVAFFFCFHFNKLWSSVEHFNLITSRVCRTVFNNHRASGRETLPLSAQFLKSLGQTHTCASQDQWMLTGLSVSEQWVDLLPVSLGSWLYSPET